MQADACEIRGHEPYWLFQGPGLVPGDHQGDGVWVAAYAAFAGLECIVFVPNIVAAAKIKQIKAYGADIRFVDGDYSLAMKQAEDYVGGGRVPRP